MRIVEGSENEDRAVSAVRVRVMKASSECGQASRVNGNHPRVIQVGFRIPDLPKGAIVRTRSFFIRHGDIVIQRAWDHKIWEED